MKRFLGLKRDECQIEAGGVSIPRGSSVIEQLSVGDEIYLNDEAY